MHHTKSNLTQVIDQCEAKLVVISRHLTHLLPVDPPLLVIIDDNITWYGNTSSEFALKGVTFDDFLEQGLKGNGSKSSASGKIIS